MKTFSKIAIATAVVLALFGLGFLFHKIQESKEAGDKIHEYELTYYNGSTERMTAHGSITLYHGCTRSTYANESRCGVRKFKRVKP